MGSKGRLALGHLAPGLSVALWAALLIPGATPRAEAADPVAAPTSARISADVFVQGPDAASVPAVPRDAFVTGFSVLIDKPVTVDLHLAGFGVTVNSGGAIGGDLYAVGGRIDIDAAVGDDLTVSGASVTLGESASVGGNARVATGELKLSGPVAGNLNASAGSILIDAAIDGDVSLSSAALTFGSDARIGGTLRYASPSRIDIPASVIAPERVSWAVLDSDVFDDWRDVADDSMPDLRPSAWSAVFGTFVTLLFLLVVAALFLAFAPQPVERLRVYANSHPWHAVLMGFLGLGTVIGLIPVGILTLIGIPLVPIVLLSLFVFWILGYLLGVYAIVCRIWSVEDAAGQPIFRRLVALGIGIVVFAALNFIPFIGWLINLMIMLLGLGALTTSIAIRLVTRRDPSGEPTLLLTYETRR